jgi:hypothetical protein
LNNNHAVAEAKAAENNMHIGLEEHCKSKQARKMDK